MTFPLCFLPETSHPPAYKIFSDYIVRSMLPLVCLFLLRGQSKISDFLRRGQIQK